MYLSFHVNAEKVLDGFESHYGTPPSGPEEAVTVRPGSWIGATDEKGVEGSLHVHLEVYEYFDDEDLWDEHMRSQEESGLPDDWTEDAFDRQRVNPLTVFDRETVEIDDPGSWPCGDGAIGAGGRVRLSRVECAYRRDR